MSAREFEYERVREACALRDAWLAYGLSTRSAERAEAEDAVGEIHRLFGEPRPRFEWVASPAAALDAVRDGPGFRSGLSKPGALPLPDRLAGLESGLRERLDQAVREPRVLSWASRGAFPD
ncbi:hypothetical protein ACWFQ8_01755 [Streptomyces sp. NPDC055254]